MTTLTVAVCTYRRFDDLQKCLSALSGQWEGNFTLLIIDNSLLPDESCAFSQKWSDQTYIDYRITEQSGLSYARNCALDLCDTEYIAFLDDDAVPRKNWARETLVTLERYRGGVGVLGGKVLPVWERERPEWLTNELLAPLAVVDWGEEELPILAGDGRWLVGANIVYRVDALRRAGAFNPALGRRGSVLLCHEELAVNERIAGLGFATIYSPSMVVDHLVQKERMTLRWMFEDAYWESVSRMIYRGVLNDSLLSESEESVAAIPDSALPAVVGKLTEKSVLKARDRARRLAAKTVGSRRRRITSDEADGAPTTFIVIIPVLNRQNDIGKTLDSIANQTGSFNIRLHVQDGESTDGTVEVLEQFSADLLDGTIKPRCNNLVFSFHSEKDEGMYDALSRASEILPSPDSAPMTWINAGDFFLPGAFGIVDRTFTRHADVSWLVPPVFVYEEESPRLYMQMYYPKEVVAAGLCDGISWRTIQQEGSFWRVGLWERVGGVDRSLKAVGDWKLWKTFAEEEAPYHLAVPIAAFSVDEGQLSMIADLYQAELQTQNKSRTEVASFLKDIRSVQLSVPVLTTDGDVDWRVPPYREMMALGATEELTKILAQDSARQGVDTVSLDDASSSELLHALERRNPNLVRGLRPRDQDGWAFRMARSVYRWMPERIRLRLRPTVRRYFM